MLREIYERVSESGVTMIVVEGIIILTLALSIHLILHFYFKKRSLKLSKGKQTAENKLTQTRIRISRIFFNLVLWIITIIYLLFLIPGIRAFSISLLAGAGIVIIMIGFAAQKTLGNIVSGISIAVYAPFKIGDRLKIGEEFGDVEDINLSHTVIKTWENKRLVIPNSKIVESEIFNFSIKDEKLLVPLNIRISYDSNINKARKIILKIANKHPDIIIPKISNEEGLFEKKEPIVRVTECGDFAVTLTLYYWVNSPKKARISKFDILEEIKKEFDNQGIEIPFPHRTIVYKKDLEEKSKQEYGKEKEEKK